MRCWYATSKPSASEIEYRHTQWFAMSHLHDFPASMFSHRTELCANRISLHSTVPLAPQMIPEDCSAENNSVTVAWQAPNHSFVQGYVLELDDGSGGEFRVSLHVLPLIRTAWNMIYDVLKSGGAHEPNVHYSFPSHVSDGWKAIPCAVQGLSKCWESLIKLIIKAKQFPLHPQNRISMLV